MASALAGIIKFGAEKGIENISHEVERGEKMKQLIDILEREVSIRKQGGRGYYELRELERAADAVRFSKGDTAKVVLTTMGGPVVGGIIAGVRNKRMKKIEKLLGEVRKLDPEYRYRAASYAESRKEALMKRIGLDKKKIKEIKDLAMESKIRQRLQQYEDDADMDEGEEPIPRRRDVRRGGKRIRGGYMTNTQMRKIYNMLH